LYYFEGIFHSNAVFKAKRLAVTDSAENLAISKANCLDETASKQRYEYKIADAS